VQQPWSQQDIERALFDNFTEAQTSIDETEGGRLWGQLDELQDSLWIFDNAVTDLLDTISQFAERSSHIQFWQSPVLKHDQNFTNLVKLKMFQATSALAALVDHARNFQKKWNLPAFDEKRKTIFGDDGLHEFLKCLRNYNSHWRVATAEWRIHSDPHTGERKAAFILRKKELLAWENWSAEARHFIDSNAGDTNVHGAFSAYRLRARQFYEWHKGQVIAARYPLLSRYFSYRRILRGLQRKHHWNLLLAHVKADINPYQYFDRYLTQEQIERVLSCAPGSDAQIDALAQALDMHEFINEPLREKLRKLLAAAPGGA
jgi:hypothetical protein